MKLLTVNARTDALTRVVKFPVIGIITLLLAVWLNAQEDDDENVYLLSPFEVNSSEDVGYLSTNTLAGTRIRTDLNDVGSAISVVTQEFLRDTGATDNESLLIYTTGTEISGVNGTFGGIGNAEQAEGRNFVRPNTNNRVRGLDAADNTRNFFLTDIPWDSYNTDRIDIQRGPNAILFGIGSPAGIINANITGADFLNTRSEIEFRFGSHGSYRASFNTNQVVLEDELAFRVAGLYDEQEFKQDPAFERDRRYYIAGRYAPAFLQTDNSTFTLKFNYEDGNIDSNRPRTRPPEDRITDWFGGANKITAGMVEAWNDIPGNPNSNIVSRNDGAAAYVNQIFGGHKVYFENPADGNATSFEASEIQYVDQFSIGPDGSMDGGTIDGFPFQRAIGLVDYPTLARNLGLPFADTLAPYVRKSLTDTSIFDYENILLDGPNKAEWRDFETYNVGIEQSFFDGLFGVEATYDYQQYTDGRSSIFGDEQPITVDINSTRADGSPNPNVGRPVVYNRQKFNNTSRSSLRESYRATAYLDLDFEKIRQDDGWLTKLLGRHVLTGLYSNQDITVEDRDWYRMDQGGELAAAMGTISIRDNNREIQTVSYLGDSLQNVSSASGLNLPGLTAVQVPNAALFHTFDSRWNTSLGVDPSAPWTNPFDGSASTQSENPANYLGWVDIPANATFNPRGTVPGLYSSGQKNFQNIESTAFIWQAYLWDELFVITYGHRRDEAESTTVIAPQAAGTEESLVYDPAYTFGDEPDNTVLGSSDSWSIVMHTPDYIMDKVGFLNSLSFFYNESRNFQPAANRVDQFAQPIGAPSGNTTDYGFTVSALDNKLALKVNFYESTVANASFDPGNLWFLGAVETRAWVAAKGFEAGLNGDPAFQNNSGLYTAQGSQTLEEARALQQTHVNAVLSNVASDEFWSAWGAQQTETRWRGRRWDPWAEGGFVPPGLTSTADKTSEGMELELFYNPTDNWTLTFNAAQVEAMNSNMAGTLKDWVEERNAVWNGPAGDIRMWSGSGTDTMRGQWNRTFYSRYLLAIQQEGTAVGELREWQYRAVTNYSFREGPLTGFNIGGSLRWEDDVVIGYPVFTDSDGQDKFDIDNPYKGPSESHFDFWIGYGRKIKGDIDWRIQLNVRDAFADGGLIPISVQADGSPGQYRIAPDARWEIRNTFEF